LIFSCFIGLELKEFKKNKKIRICCLDNNVYL
jgi:hypothetical protein